MRVVVQCGIKSSLKGLENEEEPFTFARRLCVLERGTKRVLLRVFTDTEWILDRKRLPFQLW